MLLIYSQMEKKPIVLILSEDRSLLWDWFYIHSSQLMLLKQWCILITHSHLVAIVVVRDLGTLCCCLPWQRHGEKQCEGVLIPCFAYHGSFQIADVQCQVSCLGCHRQWRNWSAVPMAFLPSFLLPSSKYTWLCPLSLQEPAPDATKVSLVFSPVPQLQQLTSAFSAKKLCKAGYGKYEWPYWEQWLFLYGMFSWHQSCWVAARLAQVQPAPFSRGSRSHMPIHSQLDGVSSTGCSQHRCMVNNQMGNCCADSYSGICTQS